MTFLAILAGWLGFGLVSFVLVRFIFKWQKNLSPWIILVGFIAFLMVVSTIFTDLVYPDEE